MLGFVNIENENPIQSKLGAPYLTFGMQYALKSTPLDFQYESTEAVSTFSAIKVNNLGNYLETVSLNTALITSTGTYHVCDGRSNYASDLDCGIYYFLVNSKYQSEYFTVFDELAQASLGSTPISVSGLSFYDSTET